MSVTPAVDQSFLAAACFELGRRCAATGMVFAMHQVQVTSITSEVGTGGDVSRSVAAVEDGEHGPEFHKQAPTVSCADAFLTSVRGGPEQVLPENFARISTETMTPVSHILWSHIWLGIATDAFGRARAFVKAGAMVANERIHATDATLLMIAKDV